MNEKKVMVDTIVAIATPPGRGGVGIIRVSGPLVKTIAKTLLQKAPEPRKATFKAFKNKQNETLDEGIALFFPNPHSFTGEDVLELQGHGGMVVLNQIQNAIIELGARAARPGEFSERAFLNDKIDLLQAESIADLIDASSEQAAKCALRSLQGEFSKKINALNDEIIELRLFVEAAIDFPDEEIDFLSDGKVENKIKHIQETISNLEKQAARGAILREGLTIVLAGKPNVGKSSILNYLSAREAAIVTDIPGTTRDIMREHVLLDGIPVNIIDTAGIRESEDRVEQEGVKRAIDAISKADHILHIQESNDPSKQKLDELIIEAEKIKPIPITIVKNKIDLSDLKAGVFKEEEQTVAHISALSGEGMIDLIEHIKAVCGLSQTSENDFIARERHLNAIKATKSHLDRALTQLVETKAGELVAEELKMAHDNLSEITGRFTADDLLGKIFQSFCIGK